MKTLATLCGPVHRGGLERWSATTYYCSSSCTTPGPWRMRWRLWLTPPYLNTKVKRSPLAGGCTPSRPNPLTISTVSFCLLLVSSARTRSPHWHTVAPQSTTVASQWCRSALLFSPAVPMPPYCLFYDHCRSCYLFFSIFVSPDCFCTSSSRYGNEPISEGINLSKLFWQSINHVCHFLSKHAKYYLVSASHLWVCFTFL